MEYINLKAIKILEKYMIKPENKGKFTEYCGGTVTCNCIEKGIREGGDKKKEAIFAYEFGFKKNGKMCPGVEKMLNKD